LDKKGDLFPHFEIKIAGIKLKKSFAKNKRN